jgi:hypothetical protein
MYWHIGERINREVLGNERADYGKQIVSAVSTQLQVEYGKKGLEPRSIWRMMQFAQVFPDIKIVSPLVSKLSWTHFLTVMPLKDERTTVNYIAISGHSILSTPRTIYLFFYCSPLYFMQKCAGVWEIFSTFALN